MGIPRHLAAFLFLATGLAAAASAAEPSPSTPGRLVLKLTEDVAAQARARVGSQGAPVATGHPRLDALIRRDGGRKLRAPFAARQAGAAALAARFPRRLARATAGAPAPTLDRIFVLDLAPDLDVDALAREYAQVPGVVWAEPERTYEAVLIPNDPYFASSGAWGQPFRDLWGLVNISASAAWDVTRGAGVVVAISDTGVDGGHPDLAGRMWTNPGEIAGNGVDDDGNGYVDDTGGWDASNSDNDPFDDNGHGTHVAGTVAAAVNNGLGVIGVAFEAQIMPVKGIGGGGSGASVALAETILYATDNGADVINASWGGFGESFLISDAVAAAHAAGVVFVAAAGNASRDTAGFFPASHPDAIAVAAFNHNDEIADFSNFGPRIDVAAPGGGDVAPPASNPSRSVLSLRSSASQIGSTVGGIYSRLAGTSMASPHVAGGAALVLSAHPTFNPEQVRQALRASADDVGAPGHDLESGYGRLNVAAAVLLSDVLTARITSPVHEALVSGLLTVTGTAAGPGFESYVLEYGLGSLPTTWVPIGGSVSTPVESGVLGTWDLTVVPDGQYVLRLRARTTGGTWFEDRVRITLDHVVLTAPALEDVVGAGGAPVEIRGTASGFGFHHYSVQYRTIAPDLTVGPWTAAGISLPGGGTSPVLNGLLATLDPAALPGPRDIDIRLTVTNTSTGTSTKQTNHVVVDPTLRPGFPRVLGSRDAFPARNLTLADLDGDGGQEILVVAKLRLYVLRADGSDLPGWQGPTSPQYLEAPPAVGDLDGDQQPEVVARAYFGIEIRHGDGTLMATHTNGAYSGFGAPVLVDLDQNGQLDILFASSIRIYALRADGTALPGFPIGISCRNEPPAPCFEGDIAVGDMDGDGSPEVAAISNGRPGGLTPEHGKQYLNIYGADGRPKLNRPKKINRRQRIVSNAPVMADVDGDGRLDVVCNSDARRLLAYTVSGRKLSFMPKAPLPRYEFRLYAPPVFRSVQEPVVAGDVNQDGFADVFIAMSFPDTPVVRGEPVTLFPPYVGQDHLVGLTSTASLLPYLWGYTFPYSQADKVYGPGTPAIGDIDGDGGQNVVVGTGTCAFWGGLEGEPALRRCYTVYAFDENGSLLPGFPKPTARYGSHKGLTPALGDLDGDGLREIVWIDGTNQVSAWTVPGTAGPSRLQWPMFRGGERHTGAFVGTP